MIEGLDVGGYRMQAMTERQEIEERRQAAEVLALLGPEKYTEFVLQMALKCEAIIRQFPNHPAIPLLDEYHARERSGLPQDRGPG